MIRQRRLRDWSAIARAINAQMAVAAADADAILVARESRDFFCECGRLDCGNRVALTVSEYAARREAAGGAVVADGHKLPVRGRLDRRRAFEAQAEASALRNASQIRLTVDRSSRRAWGEVIEQPTASRDSSHGGRFS